MSMKVSADRFSQSVLVMSPRFWRRFFLTTSTTSRFSQDMALPGSFSVGAAGEATYNVPIAVPPGMAGMHPSLSLEYNSQGASGILGIGWSLTGLSAIGRCARTVAQRQLRRRWRRISHRERQLRQDHFPRHRGRWTRMVRGAYHVRTGDGISGHLEVQGSFQRNRCDWKQPE
jgi:hypothetical protein